MYSKQWLIVGCMSGFFGVVLGAFGAHFMKDILSEKSFVIYQTAVQYQMIHAVALIGLGLWAALNPQANTEWVGWAFTAGIVLFSGSLYSLAVTQLKFLGAIAPLGGTAFLAGWIGFAILAWKA